jgi:GT2 family glycosyltransferase
MMRARLFRTVEVLAAKIRNRSPLANFLQIFVYYLFKKVTKSGVCTPDQHYQLWITRNEPDEAEIDHQTQIKFSYEPLISIVTPTYNTPEEFLIDMLESVLKQTYAKWELCLADGASQKNHVKDILETYSRKNRRIKVKFLSENKGIVGNSNEALALTTGEFIGLLDHDDILAPFALFEVVKHINDSVQVDYLYSDEDKISQDGLIRFAPHFKPDWSPDTLRSMNYPTHFSVFRKSLLDQIGGFREGFDGSQDYDLILRASEKANKIVHIPKVLYHWRVHERSTATNILSKGYAYDSAKKALQEHLNRTRLQGNVEGAELLGFYKVTYLIKKSPTVSIIIPNTNPVNNLERCVISILKKSHYRNFEILIVESESRKKEAWILHKKLAVTDRLRIVEWKQSVSYSAIYNFALNYAKGEMLLFLHNDTRVITADWLERMLEHAIRKEVGTVGAKLYYSDYTIQHAGLIIGLCGPVGHAYKSFPGNSNGYMGRLKIIQNVSAVTAACLMIRKDVFQEVGGFDDRFRFTFYDADLCVKIREKGYVIVWTPYAEFYHYESKTEKNADTLEKPMKFEWEKALFQQKWKEVIERGDPYYNPIFTVKKEDFSLQ